MSIETYLNNVREKPEHLRKRFAFWWAFSITAVIGLFWLGSFNGLGFNSNKAVATAVQKVSSPGQSLVAGVGALGKDVWELVFGPKKVTYSAVEILPGK